MFEDIRKVLLITDMDGTFLPASKIPSRRNLEAIARFQRDGGRFSIATGRSLQASQQYFEQFDVNAPIIMCNGGMVYDIHTKQQIYDVFLPEKARDITEAILKAEPEVGCEVLLLDGVYVPQMTEMERQHCRICKVTPKLSDVRDIPSNWYKVLFAREPDKIDSLISYVENSGFSGVDFVRSAPVYYEMLPLDISKGSALAELRRGCGMEDHTIVAVGDYNNDIEMLRYADVSFCPANATDEVKQAVDHILDVSCEEDVIAEVIGCIYSKISV
ncbi:MAG: Cof-type HAD-IIB family hydrolase [Ruminococcus sp.]|nr:Cof-type HAD-IIB family hydrolase [Ruminococcus sp.]